MTAGVAAAMKGAAGLLVDGLTPDQRRLGLLALDDETQRTSWHYTPRHPRRGLRLADLTHTQAKAVGWLVASGLSLGAFATVQTIVNLENVLDEIEERRRSHQRDPGLYRMSLFGSPADDVWGWRFEGHHISLHFTVAGDEVAFQPLFLGANPARVADQAPLRLEEDLGRALAAAAPAAVYDGIAPDDILTTNEVQVAPFMTPGVAGSALGADGRRLLGRLIEVYRGRVPADLAVAPAVDDVTFAWAGGLEPGQGHYYRLQAPGFLVEYDNTQDGANHVHTVWRHPGDDFGASLLARHYRTHEHRA
jgi:hypothetical protein